MKGLERQDPATCELPTFCNSYFDAFYPFAKRSRSGNKN